MCPRGQPYQFLPMHFPVLSVPVESTGIQPEIMCLIRYAALLFHCLWCDFEDNRDAKLRKLMKSLRVGGRARETWVEFSNFASSFFLPDVGQDFPTGLSDGTIGCQIRLCHYNNRLKMAGRRDRSAGV
jgi:hypothetical protein